MKRLFGIFMALVMVIGLAVGCTSPQQPTTGGQTPTGGGTTPTTETIKWRLVSTWTPAINLIEADRRFAANVGALSGGRLQIEVHPADELVPAMQVFDSVSAGTFECGGDWPGYWSGKEAAIDLMGSYPMGLCQYDITEWYYHYGGKELFNKYYGKHNMVYFLTGTIPMESGIRTKSVPIKTAADYKGLKLRMSGKSQAYILTKLGASQVALAGGEIYQALQLGTIDGAEFSTPATDWGMGFGEITKYQCAPGWHQPSGVLGAAINKQVWDKLPDDLKIVIEKSAEASVGYICSWFDVQNIKALENFSKAGVQVTHLDEPTLKLIEQYINEYTVDMCTKDEGFKEVALSMFRYLRDYAPVRDSNQPFQQGRNPWALPKIPGL